MPNPRKGESKSDFISRFMKDDEAQRDFPDTKQRVAVAYSIWDQKKKKKKKTKKEALVVTKDVEIILDGRKYLLEAGDKIYIEDIDWTGLLLDVAGLVPVVGEPADAINAVRLLDKGKELFEQGKKAEGLLQILYAAISIVSMLPAVGDTAKLGKYGIKFARLFTKGKMKAKTLKEIADKFEPVWRTAAQSIDKNEKTKGFAKYVNIINDAFKEVHNLPDEGENKQTDVAAKKPEQNAPQTLAAHRDVRGVKVIMEQLETNGYI